MSMLEDFRVVRRWALADLTALDRNRRHDVYLASDPRRVIPYILLVRSCIAGIIWRCYNGGISEIWPSWKKL
jgi:hypothetical protein